MVVKIASALSGMAAAAILFPAFPLAAATVTNLPVADAEIRQSDGVFNAGNLPSMVSGKLGDLASGTLRRSFLRFSLDNIPSAAIITNARVEVTVTKVPFDDPVGRSPVDSTFDLRATRKNWAETEVTWLFASSLQIWTSPGGSATNDVSTNASSSVFVEQLGTYTFTNSSQLVADLQEWLQNPSTNFGWQLISRNETSFKTARHFGTRESATPARLIVDYIVPVIANPPTIAGMRQVGDQFQFSFLAERGIPYSIERRSDIASGIWQVFTNYPAQSQEINQVVSDSTVPRQQFYRVRSP